MIEVQRHINILNVAYHLNLEINTPKMVFRFGIPFSYSNDNVCTSEGNRTPIHGLGNRCSIR